MNAFSPAPVRTTTRVSSSAGEPLQPVAKLLRVLQVERVEGVGAIDGDGRDAAVALDVDRHAGLDGSVRLEEVDDLGHRRSRREDLRNALALELLDIRLRDRPADDDEDVLHAVFLQPLEDSRDQRHVRAREDRDADRVRVLLDGSLDDLLGRLVQARVDDLHARVAQGPGDDLRPPVVAVQTRLRNALTRIFLATSASIWRCG